jgi:hypothetical protein
MRLSDVGVTLDRARSSAPRSLLAVTRRLGGSAMANALHSMEQIAAAVEDRGNVLAHLYDGTQSGDVLRLSPSACLDLLATRTTGRFAYIARAGTPDIVPVNYSLCDGDVFLRSAPGPKLQAAERHELVAFEVDDLDDDLHTGWSVVVIGRAERLTDQQAATLDGPKPWATGTRKHVVRIHPSRIDGRQLL